MRQSVCGDFFRIQMHNSIVTTYERVALLLYYSSIHIVFACNLMCIRIFLSVQTVRIQVIVFLQFILNLLLVSILKLEEMGTHWH